MQINSQHVSDLHSAVCVFDYKQQLFSVYMTVFTDCYLIANPLMSCLAHMCVCVCCLTLRLTLSVVVPQCPQTDSQLR